MCLFFGLVRNGCVVIVVKGLKVDFMILICCVKKLEDLLNCKLFELIKKGYVFIIYGSELVMYIEKVEYYFLEV